MGGRNIPPPRQRAGGPDSGKGRRRGTAWIVTGLMLCWLLPATVQAQIRGVIVGPGAERYRMAVSPLKNLGIPNDVERLSERIADVIADDLDRSGWFSIIDRSAYIEHPQRNRDPARRIRLSGLGDHRSRRARQGRLQDRWRPGEVRILAARRIPSGADPGKDIPGQPPRRAAHGTQIRRRDHPEAHRRPRSVRYQDRLCVHRQGPVQGDIRLASGRDRQEEGHQQPHHQSVPVLDPGRQGTRLSLLQDRQAAGARIRPRPPTGRLRSPPATA